MSAGAFGVITESEARARGLVEGARLAELGRVVYGFCDRLWLCWPVRAFMPVSRQPAGWRGGVPS